MCDAAKLAKRCGDALELEDDQKESAGKSVRRRTGCGGYLPKYQKDGLKFNVEFGVQAPLAPGLERKRLLSTTKIHEILKNVSDDDCRALGLNPGACPALNMCVLLAVA